MFFIKNALGSHVDSCMVVLIRNLPWCVWLIHSVVDLRAERIESSNLTALSFFIQIKNFSGFC